MAKEKLNEALFNTMVLNEKRGGEIEIPMPNGEVLTAEKLADMCGMGDAYRQGKQQELAENKLREKTKSKFVDLVERMDKVPRNIGTVED
jgi:hypothetical protein